MFYGKLTFDFKIWPKLGGAFQSSFCFEFDDYKIQQVACAMNIDFNPSNFSSEALAYCMLNELTKTSKPLVLERTILPLEYCEVCESYSLVKGDKIQNKEHFSQGWHSKLEDALFQKLFLSADKYCSICKRDVMFIDEEHCTSSELKSYRLETIPNFVRISPSQPKPSGQFAVFTNCRDVVCVNCVRKKRLERLWNVSKSVLSMTNPDYQSILI